MSRVQAKKSVLPDPKSQSVRFRSEIFLQKNGRERIEHKKKLHPFPCLAKTSPAMERVSLSPPDSSVISFSKSFTSEKL